MSKAKQNLGKALGRVPSGIFVVTARQGKEESALLASWVQQASFDPPTVSVAVHKDRPIAPMLSDHASFAIHVLSRDDRKLYQRFVKGVPPGSHPFEGLEMKTGSTGAPILPGTHSVLECRVRTKVDCGDHFLVIADVLEGELRTSDDPWVHIRKNGLAY